MTTPNPNTPIVTEPTASSGSALVPTAAPTERSIIHMHITVNTATNLVSPILVAVRRLLTAYSSKLGMYTEVTPVE